MDKPQIYEKVSNSARYPHEDDIDKTESGWKPGYLKQFPHKAVIALSIVILTTVASVLVLCLSDRRSSSQWPPSIQPSVVLSMLSALSSIALATAVMEGVSIAWWRRAMSGATVQDLHESWEYSTSTTSALGGIGKFNTIAIAVLASKLLVVDNILFQRATSSYVHWDKPRETSLFGVAATTFPTTGFVVASGFAAQTTCDCFMIGDSFTPVVNTWETSNGFFQGYNKLFQSCDGVCYTHIPAIGFEIDCNQQTNHTDIAAAPIAAFNARNGSTTNTSAWQVPIFNSSFFLSYGDQTTNYSSITLDLQYFQSDNPYNPNGRSCEGNVVNIQCKLRPALVNYPVTITNFSNIHVTNGVSLGSAPAPDGKQAASYLSSTTGQTIHPYNYTLKQAEGFTVQNYLYPSENRTLNSTTALGGIASALSQYLSSNAVITYAGGDVWGLKQQGSLAQTMMYGPPNMGSCDCSFRSEALDSIVAQINQLAFLTSTGLIDQTAISFPTTATTNLAGFTFPVPGFLNLKPWANVNTSTQVTVQGIDSNTTTNFRILGPNIEIRDVPFYRTHYLFLGLAVAFILICVGLVMLPFWKYGEIGRQVTLGPIEVAGAFGAPVLTTVETRTPTQSVVSSPEPRVLSPGSVARKPVPQTTVTSTTTPVLSPISQQVSFSNVEELLETVGHKKVMYGKVEVVAEDAAITSPSFGSTGVVASPASYASLQSPFSPDSLIDEMSHGSPRPTQRRRTTQVLTFDDPTAGRVQPLTK